MEVWPNYAWAYIPGGRSVIRLVLLLNEWITILSVFFLLPLEVEGD